MVFTNLLGKNNLLKKEASIQDEINETVQNKKQRLSISSSPKSIMVKKYFFNVSCVFLNKNIRLIVSY